MIHKEKTMPVKSGGWLILCAVASLVLSAGLPPAGPAQEDSSWRCLSVPSATPPPPPGKTPAPVAPATMVPAAVTTPTATLPVQLAPLPHGVAAFLVENWRWIGGGFLLLAILGVLGLLLILRGARRARRPGPPPPDETGGLPLETFATPIEPLRMVRRSAGGTTVVLPRLETVPLMTGHRTDVGRERELNEDSLMAQLFTPPPGSDGIPVGLFVVADGMGGHAAGDVASQLAVEVIAQRAAGEALAAFATGSPPPDVRLWLDEAVQAANRAVHEQRVVVDTDMGTTLVVALLVGDTAVIANVGDSRAYWLRAQGITQITTDHSLVERLVAAGQITRKEAAVHPQRNIIYRTVGERPEVEVDFFEQRLASGEALLLCSDGLSGLVTDEQMWLTWHTTGSPQEACDRLVGAANLAGGSDNITVVIAQVGR